MVGVPAGYDVLIGSDELSLSAVDRLCGVSFYQCNGH